MQRYIYIMCHKCPQCVSHFRYCLLRLNNKAFVSPFKTYRFVLLENKLQKGFQVLWTKLRISVIYQALRRILLFKSGELGIKRDIRMSNKIVSKYTIPIKANHLTHLKIWHNYPTGKIQGAIGVCSRLLIQYPRFVCICECLPYQRAQGTTYFIEVES